MEVGRARGGNRMTGVVRDRRAKADEVTIKGGGGAAVFEERRKRRHSDGEKAPVKFRKSRPDVSRSRNTGGGGKGRVGSGEAASYAGGGEKKDEEEMETADMKEIDGNVVEGDEKTLPIVPFVENVDSIATKPENVEEEEEEKLLLVPPIGNNPNWPNAEKKKLQQSSIGEEVTELPSSKISLNFHFFFFITSMSKRSDFYMIGVAFLSKIISSSSSRLLRFGNSKPVSEFGWE